MSEAIEQVSITGYAGEIEKVYLIDDEYTLTDANGDRMNGLQYADECFYDVLQYDPTVDFIELNCWTQTELQELNNLENVECEETKETAEVAAELPPCNRCGNTTCTAHVKCAFYEGFGCV